MSTYAGTITGPIAPFNNVPINPQYYAPREFFISTISLGQVTTVTTTVNHDFVIGQECRFVIPPSFGTRGLNGLSAYVILIPAPNQLVLDIDSSQMSAFTPSSATTQPQILPIGDIANGQINSNGINSILNYIPGSFINISPL